MTTDERGGDVLPFPHVALPPSFAAGSLPLPPAPAEEPLDASPDAPPVGAWPSLPDLSTMRPPLHLTVPGVAEAESEDADDEGGFVPPAPEDPDRPGLRDAAVMGMAVLAAVGVAAAQGMWHVAQGAKARVDHRRAVAQQAQKAADKGGGKSVQASPAFGHAAKTGSGRTGGGSSGASGPSGGSKVPASLRSNTPSKGPDRSAASRSGPTGPTGKGDLGRSLSGSQSGVGGKSPKDKDRPALERIKGRNDRAAARQERRADLKAARQSAGLADRTKDRDQDRVERRRAAKEERRAAKRETAAAAKKSRDAKPDRTGRTTLGKAVADESARRLAERRGELAPPVLSKAKPKDKAAKKSRDAKPDRPKVDLKKHPKDTAGTGKPAGDKPADPPVSGPAGPDPAPGDGAGPEPAAAAGSGPSTGPTADDPGFEMPGFSGMKPPPAADRSYTVTLERDDPPPAAPDPAAISHSRPALGAATLTSAAASSTPPGPAAPAVPPQRGARFVSTPVKSTQYKDAELTIYDVIDADTDVSEEITEGVDEARAAVEGCDKLLDKLERLHAKIVDLAVPGVLAGMVVRLAEKTETVKARAEAIAANLPRASEAISTAGSNAASRHRHLADVTRDMGHTRPAERDYHNA